MASILNSVEEHPQYLFDHLICAELKKSESCLNETARCVAIDPFTSQIYVIKVADDMERKLAIGIMLIFSKSGEFLRSFSHEKMEDKRPFNGMAVHKDNVYIVSGLSCFHHFKVADSMSLIRSKNEGGTGYGEFRIPRQLDISNEGDLFVADSGNNRVQILDGNLRYKRHISHHSMLNPCFLKLTSDEVYLLGDIPEISTYCIHIFTHMGKKIRYVTLNGISNSMRCRGFCVDTYGNVIIIDNSTSQIKFLTEKGNLFETMSIFDRVIGVAWMTEKLIVLTTDLSDALRIYF